MAELTVTGLRERAIDPVRGGNTLKKPLELPPMPKVLVFQPLVKP